MSPLEPSTVTVALAADDNYARPLAAALRSVVANLEPSRTLTCCILDMGITPENKQALMTILANPNVGVLWNTSLHDRVQHLPNTWPAITRATYARLFLPDVLPTDVHRVLYLDSDVMARRCVGELFATDMEGYAALAVPDTQSPFVSSPAGVPFWFERGRSAADLNFNAGVMLIDLGQWRETDVAADALAYLTDGRHHFAQDQEALNSTLSGRIGPIDPRWNQQAELFQKEYEAIVPYGPELIREVKRDPWIIHFSNNPKPWSYGHSHPFLDEWFGYLDQTPYAGWRPVPPPRRARVVTAARKRVGRVARRFGLT
jgi:lipopolysaccharide biosynthesis glycosyltransferase